VEAHFHPFGDGINLGTRYCTVCAEHIIGSKIILAQPMLLLRDLGQVEAHFGSFRDSVNLRARWVHGLHRMYHGQGNHLGHTRWYSKVTWVKWKLVSVCLEIVLISDIDGCTVSTNVPRAWKIILGTPDGTPR
jgi:hypothetical protein